MCMLHLDVCLIMRPLHVHLGGSSPCRRLSLIGFAHPVVGPPLSGTGQVQTADPHSGLNI